MPLYLADKIGPLNVETVLTLIGSALGFSWIAINNTAGLFIFSATYGFFAGAITTVTAVVDAELCPTLDVVGVRMGMLLVPWAFGLLIGEPVGGAVLGMAHDWRGLQLFTGSTIAVAGVLCVAVRVMKYGWKIKTKC